MAPTQVLNAATDPGRANQMAQQALSDNDVKPMPEPPVASAPPDTVVQLPGGFSTATGEVVYECEVRELNGYDEEILARIPFNEPARLFSTILRQGIVRIGDEKATPAAVDALLMGDREFLMIAIRRVTWGDDLSLDIQCGNCSETFTAILDLRSDIPLKKLEEGNRFFTVSLRDGREVRLHLPDGDAQTALLTTGMTGNIGAINTALLAACIDVIDEIPAVGAPPVQRLSVRDRNTLLEQLAERAFGPQLGEVKVACSECRKDIDLPLSLATLFPF